MRTITVAQFQDELQALKVSAREHLAVVKLGGDEPVIDALAEGVKIRLAELRRDPIDPIEPGGQA